MRKQRKRKLVTKEVLVTFKASPLEVSEMKRAARVYAKGNLSAWVRYSSRCYTPEPWESVLTA